MPKRYKPSRRLKPKRSRLKKVARNRFFWFGVAGLFILGGLGYGFFFTPFLHIQHVEVRGAHKVSAEKLQEITREHISKKFGFFEINNLFLANASKVADEVRAAFPEVEAVLVDTMFPNTVKVTVQERAAVAAWCQQKSYQVEVSQEGEQVQWSFRECFALDGNGVMFEQKEPAGQTIVQGTKNDFSLGEQVIEQELLAKLLAFQQELDASSLFREVGLRVSLFSVVSEQRVNARISEGWELYVNPTENMSWQATKAKLVLEQEVPFAKRPQLEYIDLRFGDQAYIKYR